MSVMGGKHPSCVDRGKSGAESAVGGARNTGNRMNFLKKALA